MKYIKVLYLINNATLYGSNIALLNMIDGLLPLGIIPLVITGKPGVLLEELDKRSISYFVIHHQYNIYPRINRLRNYLTFIPRIIGYVITNTLAQKKLGKVIKKFKPDIIHTNVGPVHIGYNIAKKMGIPHVWHIREYQNLDFNMHFFPTKKSFTRKLNSKFNYNIVITKGLFSYFDMQTNAKVIYDGIDCSNRILHGNKQKYFLFVGRLEGNKGIHDVINAFISFAKDNRSTGYKLLIAGDGKIPYVNKLHKIVKKANLTDRISFFGYRNDVYILMQSATALIVASKCEGFGLITIEAIMNGCLVIGKNAGGTKEILENDNIGILYSSHEELVAAMLAVVTNGIKSYHQIIKKAQQIASVSYTKERNCREVFNVYKRVLMIE